MSLNNISLSPQLLADLYQFTLVEESTKAMPAINPVPFLGDNKKHVLLVVNKEDVPYLPDAELAFLTTVISACGLGMADVAIVNRKNDNGNNASSILKQLLPKQVVLFAVQPEDFGLAAGVPLYSIHTVNDRQIFFAPGLNEIEASKEAKKHFWTGLKKMFGI